MDWRKLHKHILALIKRVAKIMQDVQMACSALGSFGLEPKIKNLGAMVPHAIFKMREDALVSNTGDQ